MDKFDRFRRFHRIMTTRRRPVPINELADELELSAKTVSPKPRTDWEQEALEYSGQLIAYKQAIEATGKPVTGTWVHFPVSGGNLESLLKPMYTGARPSETPQPPAKSFQGIPV